MSVFFRKKLGDFLARKAITQIEAAETLGVTQQSMSELLNSTKDVRPSTRRKVFNAFPQFKQEWDQRHVKHVEIKPVDFTEISVMYVPLVHKHAQAGYLSGFGDDEYIASLPKIPFAQDFQPKGNYLCFEVKGDSMDNQDKESYFEGDILLCREIGMQHWKNKFHIDKWDFVICHKEEGILLKRIINHDVNNGDLTLHSLNPFYDDFVINLNDVAKIFNVVNYRRNAIRR